MVASYLCLKNIQNLLKTQEMKLFLVANLVILNNIRIQIPQIEINKLNVFKDVHDKQQQPLLIVKAK